MLAYQQSRSTIVPTPGNVWITQYPGPVMIPQGVEPERLPRLVVTRGKAGEGIAVYPEALSSQGGLEGLDHGDKGDVMPCDRVGVDCLLCYGV